ncbi:MAG TPA: DUF86 domain-containing protein [archaeon]|nr:DUF86 domain-containing protein [archaeon]
MPKKRNFILFIQDILEAIGNIEEFTQNMGFQDFLDDKKTRDAVIRNLEVIGEAAKNIPDEIKQKYSEIEWKAVTGMRDKLIHEYFGVSNSIVWETATNDIEIFKDQIKIILEKENI